VRFDQLDPSACECWILHDDRLPPRRGVLAGVLLRQCTISLPIKGRRTGTQAEATGMPTRIASTTNPMKITRYRRVYGVWM